MHTHIDVNECMQQGVCNNGQCNNTPGSFICSCPPGYDLASDGKRCIGNINYAHKSN